MKVIEILDQSQTYMEQNLNAACNNMSLLTSHAFEFGSQIERKSNQQLETKKFYQSLENHTTTLKSKSESLA